MNLWNIEKSVLEIKQDSLSEWEKAKFYIAIMLFQFVTLSINGFLGNPRIGLIGFSGYVMAAIVGIFGLVYCFKANKNYDNKNFIERLIIIGLPLGIRLTVYFLIAYILIIFYAINSEFRDYIYAIYGLLSSPIYYGIFYYFLNKQFLKLSS